MDYVQIEDGKIANYFSAAKMPEGDQYKEVNGATFQGSVGLESNRINWETGKLLSDEELIETGIIEDTRGDYWHKTSFQKIPISDLKTKIPDELTNIEPPEGYHTRFTSFDEDSSLWVTDDAEKELYEKEKELSQLKAYLASTDYITAKIVEGVATLDDYADIVTERQSARDQINVLEEEIETSAEE